MKNIITVIALSVIVLTTLLSQNALAYIGPGAGIGAIGTVLALIGAVLLAIVGFVWYPVKRLIAWIKGGKDHKKAP